jgi:cation-transporting P-type ATPase 13A2
MLYPKPHKFKFYQDSFKFIGVLCMVALIGFIYSILISILVYNMAIKEMILNALDVVTIVIPPALPVAMSAGITFALDRLSKQQVCSFILFFIFS